MNTHNSHTEKELIQLLKQGDTQAFASLYQLYAQSLIDFTAFRVCSVEDARDIIHDIFTGLWDKREVLDIHESIKAYLFAAARYRIVDYIRKNANRKEYAVMMQQLSDMFIADQEAEIISKNLQDTLEHSIGKLPSRTREIYQMSRNHHLAIKEIACRLGLSEQTVKNQLSTALHHLRHSWEKMIILVGAFFL